MRHTFWVVFQKEWLLLWRDKRSLIINIALSILILPLLILAPYFLMLQSTVNDMVEALPVAISGLDESPSLRGFINQNSDSSLLWQEVADATTAVAAGEYKIGLVVPPGFDESLEKMQPATLQIISLSGQQMLETNITRVESFLENFAQGILQDRLQKTNLPAEFITPFETSASNISPANGGFQRSYLGWLIYMMTAMYIFGWTSTKAVDLSSGEKERQTIESILFTPANRSGIILAKIAYTAIHTITFIGLAFISMIVFLIALAFILLVNLSDGLKTNPEEINLAVQEQGLMPTFDLSLILSSAGWMFALILVMMLFFIALQMTIGYWARNEGQANTILGFGNLAIIGISFVLFNSAYIPALWHYAIPLYNNPLLFSLLASGNLEPAAIGLTLGSNIIAIILLTVLNAWMLNREEIILRT
jgi:sodium transport system permease protein